MLFLYAESILPDCNFEKIKISFLTFASRSSIASSNENTANSITNEYVSLFKSIQSRKLDCNISIKHTHIGLDISSNCIERNLEKLILAAKNTDNFLRIDMENSQITDSTFNLYLK